jgi:hypothetical protein
MEIKKLLLSAVALLSIAGATQLLKADNNYDIYSKEFSFGDCKQETEEGKTCTCSPYTHGTCTKATDAAGFYCQC